MSAPTLTQGLVQKIRAIEYSALPPEAIDMARQVALDEYAVMLVGATEPRGAGRIATQYVRDAGGEAQASVVARGFKTSMPGATYANGTMTHALDFDNVVSA